MKKMLVVCAHPDDESFGLGGTIAYYANLGVEIHLICATHGEHGDVVIPNAKSLGEAQIKQKKSAIRAQELLNAAAILGIKKVEILNFEDGYLSNAIYSKLADMLIAKMESFAPQVVLTNDRLGVTGHLDHIAISMITTFAFLKSTQPKKLYYICILKELLKNRPLNDYFVYFPEGYDNHEITTRIDISTVFETLMAAISEHQSQLSDGKKVMAIRKEWPKTDYLILQHHRDIETQFPETDIFSGI